MSNPFVHSPYCGNAKFIDAELDRLVAENNKLEKELRKSQLREEKLQERLDEIGRQ